jgi:hypothetical protein
MNTFLLCFILEDLYFQNLCLNLWYISSELSLSHGSFTWYIIVGPAIYVLLKWACWSSNFQCDHIWMWGLWEAIRFKWGDEAVAPVVGFVLLWEEEESSELSFSLLMMWGHSQKEALCKPWRGLLQGTGSVWHFDVGPPSFWSRRNKCCLG